MMLCMLEYKLKKIPDRQQLAPAVAILVNVRLVLAKAESMLRFINKVYKHEGAFTS